MSFDKKDIISIRQLTKQDIEHILDIAGKIDLMRDKSSLLKGKILATLFYEPSTRTRLSFESAMLGLGGSVLGFSDPRVSSVSKGESLYDTVKMIEAYSDILVLRHPVEGAAKLAAETSSKPVINAGDGSNQHPTQTLLDLYTIKKAKKKISGLTVALVGDLKYGRTVHSLAYALSFYNVKLIFVSPESLKMPGYLTDELEEKGIKYEYNSSLKNALQDADIVYMTRIQKERFADQLEYEKLKGTYVLEASMLKQAKAGIRVMHPLPRVDEIAKDVDDTDAALYFEQAKNGVVVRQAIVAMLLGKL